MSESTTTLKCGCVVRFSVSETDHYGGMDQWVGSAFGVDGGELTESCERHAGGSVIWVVAECEFGGAIGWCTSAQLAREFAAQYWRVMGDTDAIRIYPVRMDTSEFGGPGSPSALVDGWRFVDNDAADARAAGWLDAAGSVVSSWAEP